MAGSTPSDKAGRPDKFVHLLIFDDEAAHLAHGSSEAVRRFESVYTPELAAGPVVFTDYQLAAAIIWTLPATPAAAASRDVHGGGAPRRRCQ